MTHLIDDETVAKMGHLVMVTQIRDTRRPIGFLRCGRGDETSADQIDAASNRTCAGGATSQKSKSVTSPANQLEGVPDKFDMGISPSKVKCVRSNASMT
jgi:hypothetical protein